MIPVRARREACQFYHIANYGRIKTLQRADILRGTCPTIVSSPCICLITATERGSCELPTFRRLRNSSEAGWILPYGFIHMKTTNRRRYWKTKHCRVFPRVFHARGYSWIPIFPTTGILFIIRGAFQCQHFVNVYFVKILNQDSPKFNNVKISGFTVAKYFEGEHFRGRANQILHISW